MTDPFNMVLNIYYMVYVALPEEQVHNCKNENIMVTEKIVTI